MGNKTLSHNTIVFSRLSKPLIKLEKPLNHLTYIFNGRLELETID